MPKYNYKCEECGEMEIWQDITDDVLTKCPKCEKIIEKLLSQAVHGIVYNRDLSLMSDEDKKKYNRDPERAMKKRRNLGL